MSDSEPFIIYGVGPKSENLIEKHSSRILGLMDKHKTGEVFYGKRVLSEKEVIKSGAKKIIVAARAANVRIIYRRIKDFCIENGIYVFDDNGNDLTEERRGGDFFVTNKDILNSAKEKIDFADVVSFDVFDTLIVRRCLYPTDVFEIAEENKSGIPQTERNLCSARGEIVDLLNYAYKLEKEVWLVSDMYLPCETIYEILQNLGIACALERILISCDCGEEKTTGLFDILKARVGASRKILHIGDSLEADYTAPLAFGINDAIHIPSRLDLLENSKSRYILEYDYNLPNRRVIGEFIASNFDEAAFVSPLIYCFMSWITHMAEGFDILLLSARDGFLLDMIRKNDPRYSFPASYFYISRAASVSAGIFTEDDIAEASSYPFSGTADEMREVRFNASAGSGDDEIIEKSEQLRANYLEYISSLGIDQTAKIAIVDLVSAGTSLKALARITGMDITGLFLARLGNEPLNAHAMYDDCIISDKRLSFLKNYFLLEYVLSSYQPMLRCFDENGEPVFFPERRSDDVISRLKKLHTEVLEYGERMRDVDFSDVDIALADAILDMYDNPHTPAEDEYCGRYSE